MDKKYRIMQLTTNRRTGSTHWAATSGWEKDPKNLVSLLQVLTAKNPETHFNVVCLTTMTPEEFDAELKGSSS